MKLTTRSKNSKDVSARELAKVQGVGKATTVTDVEKQKHDLKRVDPCDAGNDSRETVNILMQ